MHKITLRIPLDAFQETMITLREREYQLRSEKSEDPVVREITRRQLARAQCAIKVLSDAAIKHAVKAAVARGEPREFYVAACLPQPRS